MMLVTSIVFGQFNYSGQQVLAPKINLNGDIKGTIDTLDQYLLRSTAFYIYSAGTYGYVAPSNSFSTETGMHYTFSGNASVTKLLLLFGKKVKMTTTDTHNAMIYNCGADSLPTGATLGTGTFTTDDVDTSATGGYTTVTFATPPTVTGNFVVAITGMSAINDDTLVIICNAAGDGAGEKRLKVKLIPAYGGMWTRAAAIFAGFNADAMMIPVLDITTGISATSNDLTLTGIYPNPASSDANINFSLSKETKVNIRIFDMTGRIYSQINEVLMSGNHTLKVDLSNMSNGTYYYTVSTSEGQLTSQFQVVK